MRVCRQIVVEELQTLTEWLAEHQKWAMSSPGPYEDLEESNGDLTVPSTARGEGEPPATVRMEAASSGEEAAPELPQVQYPESPFREGVTPGSEAGGAESKGTNDLACALCSPMLPAY